MAYKYRNRHNRQRWMGQVRHPSFPSGKKRKSFLSKRDAETWEQEELEKLKNVRPDDMAFEILSEEYLDIIRAARSRGHYEEIRRTLARFLQWLSERGMVDPMWSHITAPLVQNYLIARATEQSNHRANKERSYLTTFANRFVNRIHKLPGNPFADTLTLAHDAEEQLAPDTKEIDMLRMAAKGQDRTILEAYLGTAARRDEIYRWTWNADIRLDQKQYRLGTRKTGGKGMQYEWLPMNDDLHHWLEWWKKSRPLVRNHVFYSLSRTGGKGGGRGACYGEPFKKRSHFIRSLSKRAGIDPPLGYHHLRRFVATELARAGHPLKAIQRFLRHKDLATTERYVGHVNVDLEAMAQSLVRRRGKGLNYGTGRDGAG
jgi:site-specific recombinase XerD